MRKLGTLLISIFLISISVYAQTNLLLNPRADDVKGMAWKTFGSATVEEFGGTKRFVVRNGGHFSQDVLLSEKSVGKYALLIGLGNSERIFSDNDITDHPYLYGYMMPDKNRINSYLQGQRMLWESHSVNEWRCIWGIFQVPENTAYVSFFLNQALRRGTERDGSAARFDNLGLFILDDNTQAQQFALKYCSEIE